MAAGGRVGTEAPTMDIDRTESRGTPVKKLVLAAVAGTGLLLGTAGSTLAHPGDPYFP